MHKNPQKTKETHTQLTITSTLFAFSGCDERHLRKSVSAVRRVIAVKQRIKKNTKT
jgi:hypothetical protein